MQTHDNIIGYYSGKCFHNIACGTPTLSFVYKTRMSTTTSSAAPDLENNLLPTDGISSSKDVSEDVNQKAAWLDEAPEPPPFRLTIAAPVVKTSSKDEGGVATADRLRTTSAPAPSSNNHKNMIFSSSRSSIMQVPFSEVLEDVTTHLRHSLRRTLSVKLFNCRICLENHAISDAFSLTKCVARHRYCKESIGTFLSCQINDGVLTVRCPGYGVDACSAVFTAEDIQQLVDSASYSKYLRFTEMKNNPNMRECPKCSHPSKDGSESNLTITCSACGEVFCYLHANAHPHTTCAAYVKSIAKNEMKSLKKIKAFAKQCPQCKADTEKSGGCNHMSCQSCNAVSKSSRIVQFRSLFIYDSFLYCLSCQC